MRAGRAAIARWLRRAVLAGLALAVASALAIESASTDPVPAFDERRGRPAGARLEESWTEEGHRIELLRLSSTSGLEVSLALKRPEDAPAGETPLAILLGGLRTGREAVDFLPATRGVAVAALSYPFQGDREAKGLDVLPQAGRIREAIADTVPAVQLALDHLLERDFVDAERVELVGVSLGAPFACVAGAIDDRFARVWSIHGGADPRRMISANLDHRVGFGPARELVSWLAVRLGRVEHLRPEDWVAKLAPRPFVMVNGTRDERIPRECAELLFERAREPKELVWLPSGHIDTDDTELVEELLDLVLDRMTEG